jgi:ABC-type branched-subunit amino acid transport system ATPase component
MSQFGCEGLAPVIVEEIVTRLNAIKLAGVAILLVEHAITALMSGWSESRV